MCFDLKQWGEASQKNHKNENLYLVHLSYVKINTNKMVRESVSVY